MVEYGVIAAAVALVGFAGLTLLSNAQKAYFTGIAVASTPVPGGKPENHGTTVDAATCQFGSIFSDYTVKCTIHDIRDTYANPFPPQGTLELMLDNGPWPGGPAICHLNTRAVGGATNSCVDTTTFAWTPTAEQEGETHTVWVRYSPTSAHFPSDSQKISDTVRVPVRVLSAWCGLSPTQSLSRIGIGEPVSCTARITSSGRPVVDGLQVDWSTDPSPGDGFFSCPTDGDASLLSASNCQPGPTATCLTSNGTGSCSVIYRRINSVSPRTPDAAGKGVGITVDSVKKTASISLEVVPTSPAHATAVWAQCSPANNVHATTRTLGAATFTNLTDSITIDAQSAVTITCKAYVVDTISNSALLCTRAPVVCSGEPNPDKHSAYPPVGQVRFTGFGQGSSSGPGSGGGDEQDCWLRRDTMQVQFPAQMPFGASCQVTFQPDNSNQTGTRTLLIQYRGSGGHDASSSVIDLHFTGN
jgi:hypothetical protein